MGALTDASAETFAKLPKPQQQEFLQAYYSPTAGIGYTLARTSIHSTDFSSGSYTYVADKDEALKTFSVQHDEQFRIPFIKQAMAAAGGKLTLYVSPWSPPAWMKVSGTMLGGGKLLPQYRQAKSSRHPTFAANQASRHCPRPWQPRPLLGQAAKAAVGFGNGTWPLKSSARRRTFGQNRAL